MDAINNTVQHEAEATIELSARFLAYVADNIHKEMDSADVKTALLLNVFQYFATFYLFEKDIHTLTYAFDTETCKIGLSAYFKAAAYFKEKGVAPPSHLKSALLEDVVSRKASIFALFGGQSTNEVYFHLLKKKRRIRLSILMVLTSPPGSLALLTVQKFPILLQSQFLSLSSV